MIKSILPPTTFLTYSLGCRTNQAEVESISLQLINRGLQLTDYSLQQPDIVLLNTCVVTVKAERETRKEVRKLRRLYPKSYLVVIGCGPSAKISFPEADLLIPNEQKNNAVSVILNEMKNLSITKRGKDPSPLAQDDNLRSNYISSGRKFIKIQDGCNNGCSFCLTQFLRGKPTSISPKKVIEEINFWVKKGIKEIILTGINIGLYDCHSECNEESREDPSATPQDDIVSLIENILSETKIERLSFSSIYPEMLTDDFLSVIVGNPRITQCFHLSLQSGSQTVLKRMGRKTDLHRLASKLTQIKSKIPYFTFRADIITGFPNETEKEFQETLDFIKKIKISFAHIFTYSPRKGTLAYQWPNLPENIKKERSEKIGSVVEEIRNNEAIKQFNNVSNCLIVKKCCCVIASEALYRTVRGEAWQSRPSYNNSTGLLRRSTPRNDRELYEGITENGWPVLVKSEKLKVKSLKGKIAMVKITGFEKDYLLGEIVSLPK